MRIRDRIRELRRVPASELLPNPRNWRRHPDSQANAMRGILAEVGIADAVLARETPDGLQLIDGHLRAEIVPDAILPVLVLDVDEQEAMKILATHDTITGMAEADHELLAELIKQAEIVNDDIDVMLKDVLEELEQASTDDEEHNDPEEDEFEPPAEIEAIQTKIQAGDLIELGPHRLLCGDSTCADSVAYLMQKRRAALMNTDPPYGVAYANDDRPNPGVAKPRVAKPRVANDNLTDEKLQIFLEKCFSAAVAHALLPDAAWYLWHAHLTQGYFAAAAAAAAADVMLHRQIIWVKPVLLLGRGQYHWKHEPCFMGWVKGNQPPDYGLGKGERTQTTVWELNSVSHAERKTLNHATPKPVSLFAIPLIKHTKKQQLCYEPFAGSGPQFIAADQLDRVCYGMEISPQYCQVIIDRYIAHRAKAGEDATVMINGEPYRKDMNG